MKIALAQQNYHIGNFESNLQKIIGAIDRAKKEGATDIEIHDTVLIAAAFCMFNRYVDGLATWAPTDPQIYDQIGKQRASEGYLTPPFKVKSE